ncbi:RNA polymerase sigma factor [Gemmatimonas aurantiaca T-27]|uniref:RNA polymerase sigma factor n=1 Tax=Gemmatimonas aurantiaca (strain DSM 14586 / JCM 11422 / NBRC 100505 / T-27) TaxID=379066 RepID=C1A8U9_GEMAT|nr:RNA polymerase factor sigma-54 [Gemmatimonas aurantiaca]BAH38659.1 RNA polymerase sigma factor [Gemmatimonas aurantiaca T-27]
MRTGLQQTTGLRQELKVNPRLYQAMDLLYMPLLDLQQHLKQELLTNPFLELVEPEDEEEDSSDADDVPEPQDMAEPEAPAEPEPEKSGDDEVDWEAVLLDGFETGGQREEHEQQEWHEPVTVAGRDLADHLTEQLSLLALSPRQAFMAEEFVGNINDDGYLACTLEEIRDGANQVLRREAEERDIDGEVPEFSEEEIEALLLIIQELDPPGVGARNLRECLLLQLRADGQADSLAGRLVAEAFEELIARRWGEVAKRFGISPQAVQAAADEIAKLDPKPGLRFSAGSDNYIIPDLVVEKIDGYYHIFLNDGNLPRLKISRIYTDIARDKKRFDTESKDFIATKLNSANWMIQAIEQRRQTMLKVMHYIVDRQREFFERGVQGLRPLTLREVAEAVGMHESTVSRVTNEKFVQTPRGVLPLKFFFSSGLSTSDGDDVSARGIKDQIEKLVSGEDPRNPLTDQAIVEILQETGVQIARRTVAKYRDQLGVLPARMRKRV